MVKFIPLDKMSKKKQRKFHRLSRKQAEPAPIPPNTIFSKVNYNTEA